MMPHHRAENPLNALSEFPEPPLITKIEELLGILSPVSVTVLLLGLLGLSAAFLSQVNLKAVGSKRGLLVLFWVLPVVSLWVFPGQIYDHARESLKLKHWSSVVNTYNHGRIFMSYIRTADRLHNLRRLEKSTQTIEQSDLHISPEHFPLFEQRNIHIVVLESFIDATLFTGVNFDRPPIHEELQELLHLGQSRLASLSLPSPERNARTIGKRHEMAFTRVNLI